MSGSTLEAVSRPANARPGASRATARRYTIDVDTGGTFTDGFVVDHGTGRALMVKVPSTPHDPSQSLLDLVARAADDLAVSSTTLLSETSVFRYSSTIATNAIIERRGLRVGLIVTGGAESSLYGQSETPGLVERGFLVTGLVEGVTESVGTVAPDPATVVDAFQHLVDRGAQGVLIVFAGAGRDSAHETAAKRAIREQYPAHYLGAAPVFTSAEIASGGTDAERLHTAFFSAYVHHHLAGFLYRAEERLRRLGLSAPLLVVHADGGVSRVAKTHALDTYNSGPVSGLQGARSLAERRGDTLAVTVDMGGTSVDVGVLSAGGLPVTSEWSLAGLPVHLPTVRVEAVGGAGGSIAQVIDGQVVVGPESAGARPGPACFALGGTRPTVTDADVVLGYIDPDAFLGGRMRLDARRAEASIAPLAAQLGVSVLEAAWAIKDAVDRLSAREVAEQVSAAGADPAGATILLYGGAGPLHGAGILTHLGSPRAVATRTASVFSAFSSAGLDVLHTYPVRLRGPLGQDADAWTDAVREGATALLPVAHRDMRAEGFAPDALRYEVQATATAAPGHDVAGTASWDDASLRALHDRLTAAAGHTAIAHVTLRVSAPVPHYTTPQQPLAGTDAAAALIGERRACWSPAIGEQATPVYEREALRPGNVVTGPAIVQGADTTIIVPPGMRLQVDAWGDDVLTSEGRDDAAR